MNQKENPKGLDDKRWICFNPTCKATILHWTRPDKCPKCGQVSHESDKPKKVAAVNTVYAFPGLDAAIDRGFWPSQMPGRRALRRRRQAMRRAK